MLSARSCQVLSAGKLGAIHGLGFLQEEFFSHWPFCGSLGLGSQLPKIGVLKHIGEDFTALLFQTVLQGQQKNTV